MSFYDLPIEEQNEARKRIQMIIGKKEDAIHEGMSRDQRIKARFDYDKMFEKMAKVYVKHGERALAMQYTDTGAIKKGTTPNGKQWVLCGNCGWSERSRYCGSLYIEGMGTIFTSGTLAKAFEYILEN